MYRWSHGCGFIVFPVFCSFLLELWVLIQLPSFGKFCRISIPWFLNKGMESCLLWNLDNSVNSLLKFISSKQLKSTLKLELDSYFVACGKVWYWFAFWDSCAERHSFYFRAIKVEVPTPQQNSAAFLTVTGAHILARVKPVSIFDLPKLCLGVMNMSLAKWIIL